MTIEVLLKQLEDEKMKSEALVNMYGRNFNACVKHNDYNSAALFDHRIHNEESNIKRLNVAINVIKERVA